MDNEPYRDLSHGEAADEIAAVFSQKGFEAKREFWLPDGHVADVFILTPDRDLLIIEVKSLYKASYLDAAIAKYGPWCHNLWLAVPGLIERPRDSVPDVGHWQHGPSRVGIMGVDREQLRFLAFPARRPIAPTRYAELYSLFCQS